MRIKFFLVSLITACVATVASAQNEFGKGDVALNINYGAGTFEDDVFQNSLGASLEYGIMEGVIKGKGTIAVGAQVGLGFGSETKQNVDIDCTRIRIATRGVFHYQFIPQLDTYAGITLGIVDIDKAKASATANNIKVSEEDSEAHFINPVAFAGARYMLSDSFGLNVERSWDHFAMLGVGVTLKF